MKLALLRRGVPVKCAKETARFRARRVISCDDRDECHYQGRKPREVRKAGAWECRRGDGGAFRTEMENTGAFYKKSVPARGTRL
jgi:hypothetical protein